MSQENIALVQSLYAAFGTRDLPLIFQKVSPDIQVRQWAELPWGGAYHGHEGLRQFLTNLTTHLNNAALPIERYLDAGDHVVAIGRTQGTVRANGKPFDVPLAHVWKVQDGRAVSFQPFIDQPTMRASLA
jgi:ketosteroid isomerase-like protein